jgi:orotidine-5'-phosphate decarboxylase
MKSSSTDLIVALDFPRADAAMELVKILDTQPIIYKIGLELFTQSGPEFVRELVRMKKRIFLDLKLYDIPNTVSKAARQIAFLNVEMFTIHLSGGTAMVKAVSDELKNISDIRPKILGVSVLTSFDDIRWSEVSKAMTGHAAGVSDSVDRLVDLNSTLGIDGVVCSAMELEMIHKKHPGLYTVVPGVRPQGSQMNDQARVVTPKEARELGASAIVVGRPITEASAPGLVVETLLKELS